MTETVYSTSTFEHLEYAFTNNFRDESDRSLQLLLSARDHQEEKIKNGDYSDLINALTAVQSKRNILDPEKNTPEYHLRYNVNEDNFANATLITAKEKRDYIKETYGVEFNAIGVAVGRQEWPMNESEYKLGYVPLKDKIKTPKWSGGLFMSQSAFIDGDYRKTGLILSPVESKTILDHEALHSAYDIHSKAQNDLGMNFSPVNTNMYLIETNIISEINAFRSNVVNKHSSWDEIQHDLEVKYCYKYYKTLENIFEKAFEKKIDKEVAKEKAKKIASKYIGDIQDKIAPAIDAVKKLESKMSQKELSRILFTVGTTQEEAEKNQIYSPLDDLIAWGEYIDHRD